MSMSRQEGRLHRKKRVRAKVVGQPKRPRLCVFKSAKHIYAQVIDDVVGNTIASMSTLDKSLKGIKSGSTIAAAKEVGAKLAERMLEKGIQMVVFDRSGFLYHGRVKALADAAREKGLKF